MAGFRVKIRHNKHYTIAKKQDCFLWIYKEFHAFLMQDFIAKTSAIRFIVFTIWFIVF